MAQILLDAGESAAMPYLDTPLDFVAKEAPTFSCGIRRVLGMRCASWERPLRCFPNDRMSIIFPHEIVAMNCTCLTYLSFHFISWRFFSPSLVEHYLWRVSVLTVTGAIGVTFLILLRLRFGSRRRFYKRCQTLSKRPKSNGRRSRLLVENCHHCHSDLGVRRCERCHGLRGFCEPEEVAAWRVSDCGDVTTLSALVGET